MQLSGIEKLKLTKELSVIRSGIRSASAIEKLKSIKRISEIRVLLGGKQDSADTGLDEDGMWSMTRAEYNKIPKDYRGKFEDGTPSALKLINGATTLVPVRFTDAEPEPAETTTVPATRQDAEKALKFLSDFIGRSQMNAIKSAMRGEEKQFFFDKVVDLEKHIKAMPKTYDTDGQGDKAMAYLHYFKGSGDWYITEKDAGDAEDEKEGISGQVQAFGLANLGYGGELGYISIKELIEANVELDLYWTPKTIGAIKGKEDEPEPQNEPVPVVEENAVKSAFEAELSALKLETDPKSFYDKLEAIADRIDAAGLTEELDGLLNEVGDRLSDLLNEAEKA